METELKSFLEAWTELAYCRFGVLKKSLFAFFLEIGWKYSTAVLYRFDVHTQQVSSLGSHDGGISCSAVAQDQGQGDSYQ